MSIELPSVFSRPLAQALGDLLATPSNTTHVATGAATGGGVAASLLSSLGTGSGASAVSLSPQSLQLSQSSLAQLLGPAGTASASVPTTLPGSGVDAPTQALINSVLAQLPTGSSSPLQTLAAQAWPTTLLQQLQAAGAQPGAQTQPLTQALGQALNELQTWLVQQGTLATPEGPRPYTLSLYLPASWLAQRSSPASTTTAQPPAKPGEPANAPPVAPSVAPPVALPPAAARLAALVESGVYALVLQEADARSSALLLLEFGPLRAPQVYGKPPFNPVLDPWQQQAVLQASGERGDWAEQLASAHALCDRPGCPYLGMAACPQPFCPALGVVSPVGNAPAA